jgi:hypothetical protein
LNDVVTHYLWEIVCAVVFAAAVTFLYQMYNGAYVENESVFRSIRSGQNVREIADPYAYDAEPEEEKVSGATAFYEMTEIWDSEFTGEIEIVKADGSSALVPEDEVLDAQSGSPGELLNRVHVDAFYYKEIWRREDGSIERIIYTEGSDLDE